MTADNHSCKSCEALTVNGVYCHESGCPDAWQGIKKSCVYCGFLFEPESAVQKYCGEDCYLDDTF